MTKLISLSFQPRISILIWSAIVTAPSSKYFLYMPYNETYVR